MKTVAVFSGFHSLYKISNHAIIRIDMINIKSHPLREFFAAQKGAKQLRQAMDKLDDPGERFFSWMDNLLKQVIDNPNHSLEKSRFKEAPFPIYGDNEESRKLITDLSKPLINLNRPNEDKLFAVLDLILGRKNTSDTELDDDDKKFIPLIRHILMNQVHSGKFEIPFDTDMALARSGFLSGIEIPEGLDMNKVILTDNEMLKPYVESYTQGLIQSQINTIFENKGLAETVKHIADNYAHGSLEFVEATDSLSLKLDDSFEDLVNSFVDYVKSKDGDGPELDDDLEPIIQSQARAVIKGALVDDSIYDYGMQDEIRDTFSQYLVYMELLSGLKYGNQKILARKIEELEKDQSSIAKILKSI